ncbi:Mannosyl-oligosaccharide 1,2-alpha-mannosidase IC [Neolecta irregularis DAH-3]|uniref:alpha-1,2-Mannosidase n=1 Tax=Neolecta irregularis (strain DAH-3) TaxID=1198029 RepID=A0A1U7LPS7_NEOID|nr:Mannosyl-oligosaccharide 1,2-alpha-mannosidase IC [Neolecta irregularis DAH-3]|eukprot:OLL24639.1 Mannosyl-oligosaccharide 1,2-alpha-mannosidase IC [Neolecta irregularis DAH-3]
MLYFDSTEGAKGSFSESVSQDQTQDEGDSKPTTKRSEDISFSQDQIHFREMFYPVDKKSLIHLPTGKAKRFPKIQAVYSRETAEQKRIRVERQNVVKDAFLHAWSGYKKYAWGHDEVRPLSNTPNDPFCGWAATLVDSCKSSRKRMLTGAMDLKDEFTQARQAVSKIDFSQVLPPAGVVPLFETNIRYLGGLLSAYDLSGEKIFLAKAIELTDNILMWAFDTPNRMPMLYFRADEPSYVIDHRAQKSSVLSEMGTFELEFSRLSQITGNMTYFDAIQRITNAIEETAKDLTVPFIWPSIVNAYGCLDDRNCKPPAISLPDTDEDQLLTLGALADSFYEYLLKEYILLEGRSDQYRLLYEGAVTSANKTLLFRPLAPGNPDVLLSGKLSIQAEGKQIFSGSVEHLSCFLGGMYGLGAKVLDRPQDLDIAIKLTQGCVWAYGTTRTGIMPEDLTLARCSSRLQCEWPGYLPFQREVDDRVYRGETLPNRFDTVHDSGVVIQGHRIEENEDRQRRVFRDKMRGRMEVDRQEEDQEIRRNSLKKRDARVIPGPLDTLETKLEEKEPEPDQDRSHRFPYEPNEIPDYYVKMDASRYILRPEALESVFIMWRITGDRTWQDKGWQMIKSILKYTTTPTAHAAIENVMDPNTRQVDIFGLRRR